VVDYLWAGMGGDDMNEQERRGGSTEGQANEMEAPRGERLPARQGRRDEESLVVEIAWLVIDGAKVFRRLRRILARI
jgi:hypothetical protein